MAGSWSKGKNKKYPYYHCVEKGCTFKPVRKEKADYLFVEYLRSFEPREEAMDNFANIFKKILVDKQQLPTGKIILAFKIII